MTILTLVLIVLSIILIAQPSKSAKIAGKIMLGIILVPIIGFILLFATCLVIVGAGSIFK